MQWYYDHFPTTKSFLSSGAIMTGEASPGYLPYPDVAKMIRNRLPEPKIITVGREPIDRAYSSYRYNYADPTILKMKKGRFKGIKRGQSEEYYRGFLFSFEEMVKAELEVLRECFALDGPGVVGAEATYGKWHWYKPEFDRRKRTGEPPMIDLDGYCYGSRVNKAVPRKQWTELVKQHPDKIINVDNLHLVQSFIGRGLYTFPLEWWYASFPKNQLFFVCTEELSDMSGKPLNDLGTFLGLPAIYNFSESVQKGAFNVGGHKGYDNEVSWSTIEEESKSNSQKRDVPLSEGMKQELHEFLKPLNERLFALTGRRCNW